MAERINAGSASPRPSATPAACCRSGASGSAPGSGATRPPTPTWWRPSARRSSGGSAAPSAAGREHRGQAVTAAVSAACCWPRRHCWPRCVGTPRVSGVPGASPRRRCPGRLRPAPSRSGPRAIPRPRPPCRPISATGSAGSPRRRSWTSASGTTRRPGSPGPTRRPPPRPTAPPAANGCPPIDGDVTAHPDQDGREPGPHRGPAVGAHAERHADLPGVRLRRPERAGGGRAPAVARRRVHPQRRHPGRRAADPGGLLPVPGQPVAARRPAHHARRGAGQPGGGRGAAPRGARHHRRRAAGADRGEPGAARSPVDRGQPADRAGALALALGLPPTCPTTWTRPRPRCRSVRWPTAWMR